MDFKVENGKIYLIGDAFVGVTTYCEDYADIITNKKWNLKNGYLHNSKLGYLHRFIMKHWYGKECFDEMKEKDFVVDHLDNNGLNCCIDNLCFMSRIDNTVKGLTIDKAAKDKSLIALSIFKDFSTTLMQITISFNYPATLISNKNNEPIITELAYLLYDAEYNIVINDAKMILDKYKNNYIFEPDKLSFIDYHIEGSYRKNISIDQYFKYLNRERGSIVLMISNAPIKNWQKGENRRYENFRKCT